MQRAASDPRRRGLTLIEVILVLAVIGILSALAYPAYRGYRERSQAATAAAQISLIATRVEMYRNEFGSLPEQINHAVLRSEVPVDPWGNPYRYLNIEDAPPSAMGQVRKDKNLVPINSDFDLYSTGPDGLTQPPLVAEPSLDDIVRANDGDYIGRAEDY